METEVFQGRNRTAATEFWPKCVANRKKNLSYCCYSLTFSIKPRIRGNPNTLSEDSPNKEPGRLFLTPMFYSVRYRTAAFCTTTKPIKSYIARIGASFSSHLPFLGFHSQLTQNPTAKPQPQAPPYSMLLSRWQMYFAINIALV